VGRSTDELLKLQFQRNKDSPAGKVIAWLNGFEPRYRSELVVKALISHYAFMLIDPINADDSLSIQGLNSCILGMESAIEIMLARHNRPDPRHILGENYLSKTDNLARPVEIDESGGDSGCYEVDRPQSASLGGL